jgi:rhamnosyltransferase
VLDGGERFREVLAALASQRNASGVEYELLIIDSGSTDGSVDAARQAGARVIEIDKSTFQHGRTRNMAVSEAKGEVIALLTDDSVPANDNWLDSIVEGFAVADDVALVWGPQYSLADHPHFVRRSQDEHFALWGTDDRIELQRIGEGAEALADYEANQGFYAYFSDANGAVAKWAWEKHHYREVPYAEDQLLARELLEAGYAKVFHAGVAVEHSHHFGVVGSMKRSFDDYRGLLEVLGYRSSIGVRSGARAAVGLARRDRALLRSEGARGFSLFAGTLTSLRHHSLRIVAEYLAARADRLPDWLTRRLSKEGRPGVNPVSL